MKLRVEKGLVCTGCFFEGMCNGMAHNGNQVVDGKKYHCAEDDIIYKEVKELDINDLKKSKTMLVHNAKKAEKRTREIVFICSDGAMDVSGVYWSHYEEIKEPEYRAYTADDDLTGVIGKIIITTEDRKEYYFIIGVDPKSEENILVGLNWFSFADAFQCFCSLDGTPLGVKL